jgi:DNA-binding winged helix-turn-helix (wHTH) protein
MTRSFRFDTEGYQIGDLILDTRRRRVTRDGTPLKLGRLTYELLLLLAESAPRLVAHSEVADRLWGGRYVTRKTLRQRIRLLRLALSDSAQTPRYIRVVHGQGYRLIPDVRQIAANSSKRRRFRWLPESLTLLLASILATIRQ